MACICATLNGVHAAFPKHLLLLFGKGVFLSLLLACHRADPIADGWRSLFNGTDLTGWTGDPTVWRVENGSISGKSAYVLDNTFLIFEQLFSDFVLEAKVMLVEAGRFPNSGIQYRSNRIDSSTWKLSGYQEDVGTNYWGSLFEEAGRGLLVNPNPEVQQVIKSGEWHQYRITVRGSRLEHELDGFKTVDFVDFDQEKRRLTGVIGLQYHAPGEGFEVRYKDIRIKPLNP